MTYVIQIVDTTVKHTVTHNTKIHSKNQALRIICISSELHCATFDKPSYAVANAKSM
jgi:hypothetical protein